MDPLRELGKVLLILGVVLACSGAFLLLGARLPLRLGRLPGDIVYQGRNSTFYFPLMTCIVVSLVLTLLFWIVNLFRR
jgi:cytochrome c biogenesis factor